RHEKITTGRAAPLGNAAAFDAECRSSLCTRRYRQLFFAAFQSGNHDLCPERGLREADRNVAKQVMFAAFEELVFLHIQDNVQVASGAAFAAGISFARDPQLGAVVDAGGNFDLERLFPDDTAIAMADWTAILDDLARTVTLTAGPRDAEETLLKTHLSI